MMIPIEEEVYKNKKIVINSVNDEVRLTINGKHIPISRDEDGGTYGTNLLPYRQYQSILDLAKAIIDDTPTFFSKPDD